MIDLYTTQISFLIFEAVFCLLAALVYSIGRDPLRIRKTVSVRTVHTSPSAHVTARKWTISEKPCSGLMPECMK